MSSCQSSWKRQYNCNSHGAFIICVCVCLSKPSSKLVFADRYFLLTNCILDTHCLVGYCRRFNCLWLEAGRALNACGWRCLAAWSLLHFFGLDLDLMLLLAVAAFQVFPPHKRKINWPKPKFKLSLFSHVSQSETRFESIASHASNALQSASTRISLYSRTMESRLARTRNAHPSDQWMLESQSHWESWLSWKCLKVPKLARQTNRFPKIYCPLSQVSKGHEMEHCSWSCCCSASFNAAKERAWRTYENMLQSLCLLHIFMKLAHEGACI